MESSNRLAKNASVLFSILAALLLIVVITPHASAQLTPADIEALRQQGVQEGWTFEVGENDATKQPIENLCGFFVPDNWEELAPTEAMAVDRSLPSSFDWRNVVSPFVPIRNQGGCGSCWAFSTIGALECNILIRDGDIVDLSEQWLVSCNLDGWGCGGGWYGHAYEKSKLDQCGTFGAVLESDFPYEGWDKPCGCPHPRAYYIDSWSFIQGTTSDLKQAIMDYGPISVALSVNSAFQAYNGGVFNGCQNGTINHAIVLVGWDDSQGPSGVWFLRNSWGPNWGENGGYMRIPYNCNRIGYNPSFIRYYGQNKITFGYPDGRPDAALPDQPVTFRVNVAANGAAPVPNTGQLHYSINNAPFTTVAMTQTGTNEYLATLPPAACPSRVEWYVSAEQSPSARRYDPYAAPYKGTTYGTLIALDKIVLFNDDCELNRGWTIYTGATSGNWEKGTPQLVQYWDNGLSQYVVTQPGAGHSPSGTQCFATGLADYGDPSLNDVDGGPTDLTSPTFDLAGRDGRISYWYWTNIEAPDDYLEVSLSNNGGGSWAPIENLQSSGGWVESSWNVSDYMTPTADVKIRFSAADFTPDSLVEALVDDVRVEIYTCVPVDPAGDLNCDDVIDNFDINPFVLALTNPSAYQATYPGCNVNNADCNHDRVIDNFDINPFVSLLIGR